tara:strand:- start:53 stop:1417 length:1365 start_codon:yes stop_codon:yes gene_type:complete
LDPKGFPEYYLIPPTNDFVLVVSNETYALWTADISSGDTGFYTDKLRLAKNLYTIFEDNFDFLIAFSQYDYASNLDLSARAGYSGINASVRNIVLGIGLSLFDYTSSYGSSGRLGSFIHMPLHYYVSSGPMLHEMMHQWGNFFFKYDSGHWGLSGVGGGQLGGFEPSTLMTSDNLTSGAYALTTGKFRAASSKFSSSFGTFANGGNSIPYSNFEKWLMGLIPASDVPNFKIPITSGDTYSTKGADGLITADNITEISLTDILSNPSNYDNNSIPKEYRIRSASNTGSRNPNYSTSRKNFRALIVLITNNTLMEQYKYDTYWDTESNSWSSKPGSTKTLDDFQSSIAKFALNSGDNSSAYIEKKWQPVPAGSVAETLGDGKEYIKIPDTNYNFWEATGGLATLQIDNLSGSIKSDLNSRFVSKGDHSDRINIETKKISHNIVNDPFDDLLFFSPF